jgi:hypothetical protein
MVIALGICNFVYAQAVDNREPAPLPSTIRLKNPAADGDATQVSGQESAKSDKNSVRMLGDVPNDPSDGRSANAVPKPFSNPPAPNAVDINNSLDSDTVGEPLAPGMIEVLRAEILNAFRDRGTLANFNKFENYAAFKLKSSSAPYTGTELTGNCRLPWYDHLLRHPLGAVSEAEAFTRTLHTLVVRDRGGLAGILPLVSEKMDLGRRTARSYPEAHSPQEALQIVKHALADARAAHAAMLAPLSKAEIRTVLTYTYTTMVGNCVVGHTLNDRSTGRRIVDILEKLDRNAQLNAAEALAVLSDPKLLEQLKDYPDTASVTVPGVTGHVIAKIDTAGGSIVIGGKEANTYQLDDMGDVALVIDLGGDNSYVDGTTSLGRPVLVTLNLGGGNKFTGERPGIQAANILGVSMICNLAGNNVYQAKDLAQASTIGGVGLIVEHGGKNIYRGVRRVQAQAVGGIGVIVSHGGENDYHAAMWAQGFGGPLGFAMLDDIDGNDHYYCGGLYPNSYKPETPGYEGCGQGVGAGIRQVADGGIGVLLNGGGHNVYEFDYLSHGGGYWCGLGFARDFGGYSQRLIARKNFNGGPRTEALFQRFGCGWGCHYALGFCFDDRGHSVFQGSIMGSGMGWDCSVGALCVFAGGNRFEATESLTQGCGAQGSLGILYHYGDESIFKGYTQGYASTTLTYHKPQECGGNFSFLVNYGAGNKFGCGAAEYGLVQRGTSGGFLISRPQHKEAATAADRSDTKTTTGFR